MAQTLSPTEIDRVLDALIRRCSRGSSPSEVTLSSDECSCLRVTFLPSQPPRTRAKGFVALSAFCQTFRATTKLSSDADGPLAEQLANVFSPMIVDGLAETKQDDLLASLTLLTALFQVDAESASVIFRQENVITGLMDAIDLCPSDTVALELAHTLSQACGQKTCREALSDEAIQWLRSRASQTRFPALRAAAAVALVKLSRGALSDTESSQISESHIDGKEEMDLVNVMKGMTVSGDDQSTLSDAVEGLVYMSAEPSVKEMLSNDPSFWKQLFSHVPKRRTEDTGVSVPSSVLYGIVMIALNVCLYRPRLTEEETQMLKLKRLANSGKAAQTQDNPLDDDDHVKERCKRLVQVGLVGALSAIVKVTDSQGVRAAVGRTLLSLVENKENRGKVLQEGGAKALTTIIRARMAEVYKDKSTKAQYAALESSDLQTIQALAKLGITAAPFQVFGPGEAVLYDAIRPFTLLVIHSSANLLQRFEGMMALTNLSSASAEVASRIAASEGLMNKVELLLLEEHQLVRRAAIELICNLLAGSDQLFEKYSRSTSKLQVLVALSDVDDLPTRLASSGGLAQLTASPATCGNLLAIQLERRRVLQIFAQLINPAANPDESQAPEQVHPGLIHRGLVCVRNFLTSVGAENVKKLSSDIVEARLPKALVSVVQRYRQPNDAAILVPAAEALKLLLDCGIEVPR